MAAPKRAYAQILLVMILILGTAHAQDFPALPSQHVFWDPANKTLFATHAALEALDFGITHRNLSQGGREVDPLAKSLCQSGTAGQLVFFGGRMVGVMAISYMLHKTHHHKLERIFPLYASGDSAYGVVYSFVHR